MTWEILLLCLLCIGVFASVWELERIRQILDKQPEHFCNILWLAEFQVSLERAAFVLDENIRQVASGSGTSPGTINEVDQLSSADERHDVHDGINLHPSRRYASRLPGLG